MQKWMGFNGALVCYLLGSIAGVFAFVDERVNAWELFFVIFYLAGLALTGFEWSRKSDRSKPGLRNRIGQRY